jgi:predicted MFS family arabinose efflux permease
MNPLYLVSFMTFTAALSSRAVDPVIPQIAGDLWVTPATAAILSTAFALPYGFIQPVLGPVADAVGKTRVMTFCMAVFTLASFLSAVVESFALLLALRIVTGAACGGSFPVALAFIGDQVPLAQRQVAIGRLLAATIGGNLIGATLSGIIADLVHWRGIFIVLGFAGAIALAAGLIGFRGMPNVRHPSRFSDVRANFRGLLLNPRGQVCFGSVALEGIFLFGVFPYVAVLLLAAGEGRAVIAGMVIAAFAVGGVIYSLTVRFMLKWLAQPGLMIAGGSLMAICLIVVAFAPSWPVQCLAFGAMGCGFYMLHGSIQFYVTELAPDARGSAVALHSLFFCSGQAIGPIAFGIGLAFLGAPISLTISALAMALIGFVAARLLMRPRPV